MSSKAFNVVAVTAAILMSFAALIFLWIRNQPAAVPSALHAVAIVLSILAASALLLLGWDKKTAYDFKKVFGREVPADEDKKKFVQRNVNYKLRRKFLEIKKAENTLASFVKQEGDPRGFSTDEETDSNLESLAAQCAEIAELRQDLDHEKKVALRRNFKILPDREYAKVPA